MLSQAEVIQLLTHATVFACPSIYEPLGIVNLEAMACGTAVVGSRTGGIPEVVAEGETGLLVPPGDPAELARALNALLADPDRAEAMGQAGRKRAVAEFGWAAIAAQTADLYAELAGQLALRAGTSSPAPALPARPAHTVIVPLSLLLKARSVLKARPAPRAALCSRMPEMNPADVGGHVKPYQREPG
jgi:hypothetical protein